MNSVPLSARASSAAPPPTRPRIHTLKFGFKFGFSALFLVATLATAATPPAPTPKWPGDAWRKDHRIVDLHQHIAGNEAKIRRALSIADRVGIGLAVNLSGGTVTPRTNGPSEFENNRALFERIAPGRFLQYFNLDYTGWDQPDFAAKAVAQVETAVRLGASGLKEFKRLGLYLRNAQGELIRIDDPKLDGVWKRCGELRLPVSIHVADPRAFWLPYNAQNERWKELKDHPRWWFGDPKQFPAREELLAALDRVVARHPNTTFVSVHFGNNAEEVDWVDAALDRHPNLWIDLAARLPEVGRHSPDRVRRFFEKHSNRIVFATDFQSYDRLTLGSAGDGENPSDDDAVEFFRKEWRWLETLDRDWPHMTPIQGDWTISSIGLAPTHLRKVYFDNARRLLARTWPTPVLQARRIDRDFRIDGRVSNREWAQSVPTRLELQNRDAAARPELSTTVRALWSDRFLYLSYVCPMTQLTVFSPRLKTERLGGEGQSLWDRDVVEAFIGSDPNNIRKYTEYQWAPNGETMDLKLDLPQRDFPWSSGMESRVHIDSRRHTWTLEVRIPMTALAERTPKAGDRWRINLYRADRANKASLAWNPTLDGSFHVPERFGVLQFE